MLDDMNELLDMAVALVERHEPLTPRAREFLRKVERFRHDVRDGAYNDE